MTGTMASLAAAVPMVLARDRSRNTGSHDSRKAQMVIGYGSPGSRHRHRTDPDQSRADSETGTVGVRFFPNHRVDPTASGVVAPGWRLSSAVDHAGRSGTDSGGSLRQRMNRRQPSVRARLRTAGTCGFRLCRSGAGAGRGFVAAADRHSPNHQVLPTPSGLQVPALRLSPGVADLCRSRTDSAGSLR